MFLSKIQKAKSQEAGILLVYISSSIPHCSFSSLQTNLEQVVQVKRAGFRECHSLSVGLRSGV